MCARSRRSDHLEACPPPGRRSSPGRCRSRNRSSRIGRGDLELRRRVRRAGGSTSAAIAKSHRLIHPLRAWEAQRPERDDRIGAVAGRGDRGRGDSRSCSSYAAAGLGAGSSRSVWVTGRTRGARRRRHDWSERLESRGLWSLSAARRRRVGRRRRRGTVARRVGRNGSAGGAPGGGPGRNRGPAAAGNRCASGSAVTGSGAAGTVGSV